MSTNRTYAISSSISFLISEDISVSERNLDRRDHGTQFPLVEGNVRIGRLVIGLKRLERGLHFQPHRVKPNKTGRGILAVGRFSALHGGDLRIVKTGRTFSAGDDDVSLVKF